MQFALPIESEKQATIRHLNAIMPLFSQPFLRQLEVELSQLLHLQPPSPGQVFRFHPANDHDQSTHQPDSSPHPSKPASQSHESRQEDAVLALERYGQLLFV